MSSSLRFSLISLDLHRTSESKKIFLFGLKLKGAPAKWSVVSSFDVFFVVTKAHSTFRFVCGQQFVLLHCKSEKKEKCKLITRIQKRFFVKLCDNRSTFSGITRVTCY